MLFAVLHFVTNIFFLVRYFSAINISFENTAASPCSPRPGWPCAAIYVYRGGSKWSNSALCPLYPRRAALLCGPCVMRPVLLLLHTILAVDTTAGNEGPRSFHNHGEGPTKGPLLIEISYYCFQPREGPGRGPLCDCEIFAKIRFEL